MVVINLFTISVYSQSPTPSNCNGAFDKTLTSSSSNCEFTSHIYDANSSEYWIFFTASNDEYDLQLKNINGNQLNSADLNSIEIYSGTCSGLNSDTILNGVDYDSTYKIQNLVIGNIYFVRVNRNLDQICNSCNENKGFDLCLRMIGPPCLIWSTQELIPLYYQYGGLCGGTAGSVCHINALPCANICFGMGCLQEFAGGEIVYSITPTTNNYNFWFESTENINAICLDLNTLTQGVTYTINAYYTQIPGGVSPTFVSQPLTFTVLPLSNSTEAITSNTFCTATDLINAVVSNSGTYIDGGSAVNTASPSFTTFFNSLPVGTHTICIENIDNCNNPYTACEDFEIVSCNASFTANANCNEVNIINTTPHQSSFVSWSWDFGDGTTSIVQNPGIHNYTTPGTYIITLTATDNTGTVYITQQTIIAQFGTPMELDLPSSSCCAAPTISVNADYTNYQWNISPTVPFTDAGNIIYPGLDANTSYEVCVTANDIINGCPVTICGSIEPCCEFDIQLVPNAPTSQDNHILTNPSGNTYFTQNCEPETVSNLINNYGWTTLMPQNSLFVLRNDLIVDENLTITSSDIRVDQGKKIIIKPGAILTINKVTVSNACDNMWEGIIIENNLAQLISIFGSTITQAEKAVQSLNGGDFIINRTTFENNYRNVVMDSYNLTHTGSITQSTFTSTIFGMLSPHTSDVRPFSGVEITKVKEATVGNATNPLYLNNFEKLKYGILGISSNINVYNNSFKNISNLNNPLTNQINNTTTIPIWVKNGYTGSNSQFLNVGGLSTNQLNYFENCQKGIQVEGDITTNIIGNDFKNIGITNVYCKNTNGKAINVMNNTIRGRFGVGILCVDFLKSIVQIKNNLIDENSGYNHQSSYLNTGIWLANVVPNASLYQIENNEVFRCENGIIIDGLPTALVKNNSVYFQRNNNQIANDGSMHRGIQIKNSERAEVTLNTVSRTNTSNSQQFNGTAAMTNYLHGITVELSEESYVHDNDVVRMGYGMRWVGSSVNSTISCNIMQRCYNGIFFDNAEIGHQGSPTNPSGNYWLQNQDATGKMAGGLALPTTNWHAVLLGITNPNISSANNINILSATGNANCQITPGGGGPFPGGPQLREAMFGSIVRDEKQFNANPNENRMNNKKYLYRVLKNNPNLLSLGGIDDADYQTFFTTVSAENEGKIEDLNQLIADTNFVQAANLNSGIIVNLIADENQKTINEIYLNTWANGIEIDTNQFLILENIACQNPLDGGSAVYGARIMIGLDYECSNGANRSASINEEEIIYSDDEGNFTVYPNPSNGLFTIVNNSDELVNGKIQLLDITGKVIAESKLNSIDETLIDITDLSEGMYHYIIYSNGIILHSDKLIISK